MKTGKNLTQEYDYTDYGSISHSRFASVWIDKKNRIIFSADDNKVTFIQCGGHYDDK